MLLFLEYDIVAAHVNVQLGLGAMSYSALPHAGVFSNSAVSTTRCGGSDEVVTVFERMLELSSELRPDRESGVLSTVSFRDLLATCSTSGFTPSSPVFTVTNVLFVNILPGLDSTAKGSSFALFFIMLVLLSFASSESFCRKTSSGRFAFRLSRSFPFKRAVSMERPFVSGTDTPTPSLKGRW